MSGLFIRPPDPPAASEPQPRDAIVRRKVIQYDDCLSGAVQLLNRLRQMIQRRRVGQAFWITMSQETSRFGYRTSDFVERVNRLEKLAAPLMNASDAPPTKTPDSPIVP